ncbi:hypothetical protein Taro_017762 [Colocasia esculenta]|uniref:Cupin type-1 domain-containing protein n=1 Tax=Colocasia esculenta TaxID=4460 RepID=A0A843UNZ5_COLES|nr:hypothetical protein [Colocasia esculenta]
MAPNALIALALVLATASHALAGDPDITTDFVVPGGTVTNPATFTFTGLRSAVQGAGVPPASPFKVTKASQVEFPALDGQSVSMAVLQYAPGGINALHTHPRRVRVTWRASRIGVVYHGGDTFDMHSDVGTVSIVCHRIKSTHLNSDSVDLCNATGSSQSL